MSRLTKHFTFEEMTATQTGLDNTPDIFQCHQLLHTARILERVRARCGFPLVINSGFRSDSVNSAVGGTPHSYHLDGRAVDIDISSMSVGKVEHLVSALWYENPVELIEKASYIHVAF